MRTCFGLVVALSFGLGACAPQASNAFLDQTGLSSSVEGDQFYVDSLMVEDSLRGVHYAAGSIRIVLDNRGVVLTDSGGVVAHVANGRDPAISYAGLFRRVLAASLERETESAPIIATSMPPEIFALGTALPDSGTVFQVGEATPDYLIIVRSVEPKRGVSTSTTFEAPIPSSNPALGGGGVRTRTGKVLSVVADVLVWNNREGWPLAHGKIGGDANLPFGPGLFYYETAIDQLATRLAKYAPLPPEARPKRRVRQGPRWNGMGPPPGSDG